MMLQGFIGALSLGVAWMLWLAPDAFAAPVNDHFADREVLSGGLPIEVVRSNAEATKESGEPEHGGDPGGASVWYSWRAPESGSARIGSCCGGPELLGFYAGGSVGALTPAPPGEGLAPGDAAFAVSAGAAYRIAVDGGFDATAGEAEMGSFSLHVSMALPSRPSSEAGEGDVAVRSSESGSFRCKLDVARNVDPTPAIARFAIPKSKSEPKRGRRGR